MVNISAKPNKRLHMKKPFSVNDIKRALEAYEIYAPEFKYPLDYQEMLRTAMKVIQQIGTKHLILNAQVVPNSIKLKICNL